MTNKSRFKMLLPRKYIYIHICIIKLCFISLCCIVGVKEKLNLGVIIFFDKDIVTLSNVNLCTNLLTTLLRQSTTTSGCSK